MAALRFALVPRRGSLIAAGREAKHRCETSPDWWPGFAHLTDSDFMEIRGLCSTQIQVLFRQLQKGRLLGEYQNYARSPYLHSCHRQSG